MDTHSISGSSQEILLEFGGKDCELMGAVITEGLIKGVFGEGEIHQQKGDSLVIMESKDQEVKFSVVDACYRGWMVKSAKLKPINRQKKIKKKIKNQEGKELGLIRRRIRKSIQYNI